MRFGYLPANDNHGRVTYCMEEQYNGETDSTNFYVGITYCSPKDQFSRVLGKTKAQGYLRQGLHEGFHAPRPDSKHFVKFNVSYRYDEPSHYQAIRKVAEYVNKFVAAAVAKEQAEAPAREVG